VAFVIVIAALAELSAQQVPPRLRAERAQVTIRDSFDGILLSDAIVTLGTLADVSIRIAPEARGVLQKTRFVSERMIHLTFEGALAKMVAYAGLTYEVIDDHTVMVVPIKK
jgi:hypothetical protein